MKKQVLIAVGCCWALLLGSPVFAKPRVYDHVGHIAYAGRSHEPTVTYHVGREDGYCDVTDSSVDCFSGIATGIFYSVLEDGHHGTLVKFSMNLDAGSPLVDLVLNHSIPDDQKTFRYRLAIDSIGGTKLYCVPAPILDKNGRVKKTKEVCYGM